MPYTISRLAEEIGATAAGNTMLEVSGVARPANARNNQLAVALSQEFEKELARSSARAALVVEGTDWHTLGLEAAILHRRPRFAFALITERFITGHDNAQGIHPTAIVESSAGIGKDVSIGPYSIVAEGVMIGDGSYIGSHVTVGRLSRIGKNALIFPGTQIGHEIKIGNNFVAQSNVVVGSDGFSYETSLSGTIDAAKQSFGAVRRNSQTAYTKIHSFGKVVIGDNVELGACTTIDRGTLDATVIGSGTKVDNHVHIAHNTVVGKDCLICGMVGIAGSASIGDRVVLAGMCGVKDHVRIGNDVVAGGSTKIFSNVPSNRFVMGSPAIEMSKHITIYKAIRRLPQLVQRVVRLEQFVSRTDTFGREDQKS